MKDCPTVQLRKRCACFIERRIRTELTESGRRAINSFLIICNLPSWLLPLKGARGSRDLTAFRTGAVAVVDATGKTLTTQVFIQ